MEMRSGGLKVNIPASVLAGGAERAPKRAQRGPYTGRGASMLGLLGDRTRSYPFPIFASSAKYCAKAFMPPEAWPQSKYSFGAW